MPIECRSHCTVRVGSESDVEGRPPSLAVRVLMLHRIRLDLRRRSFSERQLFWQYVTWQSGEKTFCVE